MLIAIITPEKADELRGKEYTKGIQFNPIEKDGKHFISLVEAQYLSIEDIVELEEYIQPEEDYEN